jgi:hypothetical protein
MESAASLGNAPPTARPERGRHDPTACAPAANAGTTPPRSPTDPHPRTMVAPTTHRPATYSEVNAPATCPPCHVLDAAGTTRDSRSPGRMEREWDGRLAGLHGDGIFESPYADPTAGVERANNTGSSTAPRRLRARRHHPVPEAPHRIDHSGRRSEFVAEAPDVGVNGARVDDGLVAPDVVQEHLPALQSGRSAPSAR